VNRDRLQAELAECVGLQGFAGQSRYAPEALLQARELLRPPSAADLGSGNHFLEFCVVEKSTTVMPPMPRGSRRAMSR
jgi:tRNA-splicing ligase RtcB